MIERQVMGMKINLLCGNRNLPENLLQTKADEAWGGIDRGALILVQQNIQPVFSLGDFDSVNDTERLELKEKLDIHPVKAEKADTDLGLGVAEAVARGYDDILIYGATGGRLDHFLGALQLLQIPDYLKRDIKVSLIDDQNEITYLKKGIHRVEKKDAFPYISFIPAKEDTLISLRGFKYPLDQEKLYQGSTLTISNEIDEPVAEIEIEVGALICIRSHDNR